MIISGRLNFWASQNSSTTVFPILPQDFNLKKLLLQGLPLTQLALEIVPPHHISHKLAKDLRALNLAKLDISISGQGSLCDKHLRMFSGLPILDLDLTVAISIPPLPHETPKSSVLSLGSNAALDCLHYLRCIASLTVAGNHVDWSMFWSNL